MSLISYEGCLDLERLSLPTSNIAQCRLIPRWGELGYPMILPSTRRSHTRHFSQTSYSQAKANKDPDIRPEQPSTAPVNKTLGVCEQHPLPRGHENGSKA